MAEKVFIRGRQILRIPTIYYPRVFMSSQSRKVICNREIVGYGFNGEPNYVDRPDYPMPAIRWKETTPQIFALRQKEKGDWNKLTLAEKKALYRASFCQTYAEFLAPTGEWKSVIGMAFLGVTVALWVYYGIKICTLNLVPDTFSPENREAQLRRIIDLQINPIQGIASKWDYCKDDWKK
ncbi:cytochrome c oxidase subunit 4 isoform 1, mitochondrial-like [Anoplophora glabripennis]|uniref:cytochrome c oxidase subunit 4 isoform 1, mitochondrial-like n=1 Tax=Anoplophora glabripennis TaxID=217634 RepID=UPI00087436DE|nr:cytochrome c oxidase subunit 4 isoform 1, mitochondrial-like [Anoplophora glabripennis]